MVLSTGYLSRNGVFSIEVGSLNGAKMNDHIIIIPYGLEHDAVSGLQSQPDSS